MSQKCYGQIFEVLLFCSFPSRICLKPKYAINPSITEYVAAYVSRKSYIVLTGVVTIEHPFTAKFWKKFQSSLKAVLKRKKAFLTPRVEFAK